MTAPVSEPDAAAVALRILDAFESGNLDGLEAELERRIAAGRTARRFDEHWELLEAIVSRMRPAIRRMRSGSAEHLEGIEAQIALLKHLAARRSAVLT